MICPHCGYSLDDGVAFCIYCGTRFGKYAPEDEITDANLANAKHAADAPAEDGVGASGEPVPESAWNLVDEYPEGAVPPGPATGDGPYTAAATGAVPAAAAAYDDFNRLHSDDEIAQRMDQIDKEPRKSRKGLGAVIAGLVLVAGIAVGAGYIVPTLTEGPASSTSATASTDANGSSASDSSSTASTSTSSSATPETKRGSTLSGATHADDPAAAAEGQQGAETVDDSGAVYYDSSQYASGGSGGGYSAGAAGAYAGDPHYMVLPNPWASATSISPQEGKTTHGPDLAIDGRAETAWNTNLSGVGESITINTNTTTTINGLRIMNGYNTTDGGTNLYWANARAKKILVEYEGGAYEYTLADLEGEYQDVPLDPAATWWVKVKILSEYPGNIYEDCCISEIQVY